MPPSKLKLVKGYSVPPQEKPPSELDEAIARFLLSRQAINARTLVQYRRVLGIYRITSPEWPPAPAGIAAFIGYCQSRNGKYTIHTYYGIMRNFIRFALAEGLIVGDPLRGITPPKRPKTLGRAPKAEHLKKLFDYLESQVEKVIGKKDAKSISGWHKVRNLALYSLMLDSGVRLSEAANIRLEDVDLEEWTVFIREGKGSKQRIVPLGRTSRADLRFWIEVYRPRLSFKPDSPGRDYLFISNRRGWQPIAPQHIKKTLEFICTKAGIPKITPHRLRHGYATYAHAEGASVKQVQAILGHSDLATTALYLGGGGSLKEHLESSPRDHRF